MDGSEFNLNRAIIQYFQMDADLISYVCVQMKSQKVHLPVSKSTRTSVKKERVGV